MFYYYYILLYQGDNSSNDHHFCTMYDSIFPGYYSSVFKQLWDPSSRIETWLWQRRYRQHTVHSMTWYFFIKHFNWPINNATVEAFVMSLVYRYNAHKQRLMCFPAFVEALDAIYTLCRYLVTSYNDIILFTCMYIFNCCLSSIKFP